MDERVADTRTVSVGLKRRRPSSLRRRHSSTVALSSSSGWAVIDSWPPAGRPAHGILRMRYSWRSAPPVAPRLAPALRFGEDQGPRWSTGPGPGSVAAAVERQFLNFGWPDHVVVGQQPGADRQPLTDLRGRRGSGSGLACEHGFADRVPGARCPGKARECDHRFRSWVQVFNGP